MQALNEERFDDALTDLNKALFQAESLGSALHQAKIRNNIGLVFQAQGEFDTASQHFKLALNMVEKRIGTENRLYAAIQRNSAQTACSEA
jgi:Tfp pilus assembly protein PilF